MVRIGVYVDGFNLYYGLYRHGSQLCKDNKWLNPVRLGSELSVRFKLSGTVTRVRYFTARAKHDPTDPDRPTRQQMLVRAMETLPEVSIHWGQHIDTDKHGYVVGDPTKHIVKFSTREEKGSNVSLGVHLIRDAAKSEIDQAILISNDSDLVDVVAIAVHAFNTAVFVASPRPTGNPSRKLRDVASGQLVIDCDLTANCQFPDIVRDAEGRRIRKPAAWQSPQQ